MPIPLPGWLAKKLGLDSAGDDTPIDVPEPGGDPGKKDKPGPQGKRELDQMLPAKGKAAPGEKPLFQVVSAPPDLSAASANSARVAGQAPALTPGPAKQAQLASQTTNNNIKLDQKTTINVTTADPAAAGNQVAEKQKGVNADLVRNAKANIK